MKKLLLIVYILMAGDVTAQVTITQNDMPESGDALYRTRAAINPFLNYAATGANHVWNFNNLVATTQDSAVYQTVASTNFVYALTYIDIFLNPNRANHARPGVDIPFNNLLPVSNPFTFYYRNASVYKTVGFGMELAGIPVPVIFSDHDEIYSLPLNYTDTDSTFSSYNISLPTLAYYGYEQNRLNEVDGWGVINTPAGSFDALRVKTTLLGRDTINLDSLGLGFTIDRPVITEYKWLSPGLHIPVMQVNTTELFGIEIITDIFFYDLPRSISVVPPLANVICPGQTLTVIYDITGTFNPGGLFNPPNIFRAELSDVSGDFTTPVPIGSVTTNLPGSISCIIPANTPPGTGYRIRVVSTNPAFTGNDNGFDLTVADPPLAVVTAGGLTEFCDGDSVILSAATDSTYSYQWQLDGSDLISEVNPDHIALSGGTYTVVVTNGCGSTVSAPVIVTVNPLPDHTFSQAGFVICNNTQVTILSQNNSGQSPLNYQWFMDGSLLPGETNDSLIAGLPGNYSLEIANPATGCVYIAAVTVNIDSIAMPLITASANPVICQGDSVLLETPPVAGVTFQWQLNGMDIPGATGISFTASNGGTYMVVATTAGGCTAASIPGIDIIVNTPPMVPVISASGTTTFCAGGSVQLDVTAEPGVTYQWLLNGIPIPGATLTTIQAADSGSYTVIATNGNGCSSISASPGTSVQVNPLPVAPVISITGNTNFCQGDSVILSVIAVIGFEYQWTFNGDSIPGAIFNQYIVYDSTGTYSVFVTDMAGCSAAAVNASQVTVNPLPAVPVISQGNDTLYASGSGIFQWYLDGILIPGATSSFYIPSLNGDYSVTLTDANGCSSNSGIFPVTNVGIYENGNSVFRVFPNPSADFIQVQFTNYQNIAGSYSITDITGKELTKTTVNESSFLLDLSGFAKGVYILKILLAPHEVHVVQLIKQ